MFADARGAHGLAFDALLGAIPFAAVSALVTFGAYLEDREDAVCGLQALLWTLALALLVLSCAARSPATQTATLPPLGWSALVASLGVSMWIFMLGMLGFPLTGGFFGKFYVFAAAYDRGWWWLILAGVIATMISAYYYLGVVRAMYFRESAELQLAPAGGAPNRELLLSTGVLICVVVTVGSFFAVEPLIDAARHAARALPLVSDTFSR